MTTPNYLTRIAQFNSDIFLDYRLLLCSEKINNNFLTYNKIKIKIKNAFIFVMQAILSDEHTSKIFSPIFGMKACECIYYCIERKMKLRIV